MELNVKISRLILLLLVTLLYHTPSGAQAADGDYMNVVTRRAEKIVQTLDLNDPGQELRVRDLIAMQYVHLSEIHDARDKEISLLAGESDLDDASRQRQEERIRAQADKKLAKLHKAYLEDLSQELSPAEVDQVKDGMTYGLVAHTYHAYLSLLPELTGAQREKIMEWLVEARETAMDAGSSEEKHYWFGKYKGKINNYLSAEGYDLKKAEQKR